MALSSIPLEYGLIRDGTKHVEEEEDSADRYVLTDGGTATDLGNAVREVWRLQARQSLSVMKTVVGVAYPRRASLACLKHDCVKVLGTLSSEMTCWCRCWATETDYK